MSGPIALTLTDAEVHVLAIALGNRHETATRIRGKAERYLAEGRDDDGAACRTEKTLAAIDSMASKLPEWVAVYIKEVA